MAVSVLSNGLSWSQLLLTALLSFPAYFVVRIIYNLAIHPLRRFPGPWLSSASIFSVSVHSFKGDTHKWIAAQHEKYGPIVRIAPDTLSFTSNVWKDIYAHRPQLQKDAKSYNIPPNGVPGLLSALDDQYHQKTRKIFSSAFSEKALRAQEGLVLNYVDVLIQKLKSKAGTPVAISDWYNFTTFDIMSDLAFGDHLGLLEGGQYNAFVSMIFSSLKYMVILWILKQLPFFETLGSYLVPQSLKDRRLAFFGFAGDRVKKRIETKTGKADLWSFVEINSEKGNALSFKEMESNASLFLGAGSETTATLLTGLTYYLATNADKMQILVNEIRGAFQEESEITMENLVSLRYLNACLEEGLRVSCYLTFHLLISRCGLKMLISPSCYMPVPIGLPRRTPKEGAQIHGEFIPGNCVVMISQYATYHSANNFYDPQSFIPERWLGLDPKYANDERSVLQPFSVGPRNCIGKSLAYHEMRLILTKVLWNFDLILTSESQNWLKGQRTFALWEKPPLVVNLIAIRR